MPIERLSSEEAFDRLKSTPGAMWPDGRKRGQRLEGIAQVFVKPGFSFTRDTPVMTIGSCFARNIEAHLQTLDFDLPMTTVSVPREERLSDTANDILNKYSVHSIENELLWAFEGTDIPLDRLLLETEDGLWHDPQLAPNLLPATFERVCQRRQDVMAATRQLARCGLVIITLGLAESWFDLETGLYLNGSLPPAALRRYPGRFALDILSYAEILESLERIHALVQTHGAPGVKMLITTSPVPFKASFSGEDSLVANCYSKSVQRAACREFSAARPDVDYFPSYEVVTLTERTTAYAVDNIHVRPPVVQAIMTSVIEAYCPDIPRDKPVIIDAGRTANDQEIFAGKLFRKGNYGGAASAYAVLLSKHGAKMTDEERGRVLTNQGVALLRDRQTEQGVAALKLALSELPMDARLHYKLGLGYARLGDRDKALLFFDNALTLGPDVPDHAWRYGLELRTVSRFEEARALFLKALALDPHHAGALAALEETEGQGQLTTATDAVEAEAEVV